jgi:phosphatidylserine decarboxylase
MLIGSMVLVVTATVLGVFGWWPLALILLPVLVWLFAFFRDPERQVPAEQHVMVSPADGTVTDITEIEHDDLLGGPAVRVGIFLSIFNVHVNRSPCEGRVTKVIYRRGRFINAMSHARASEENESNTVVLAEPHGQRPIAVVKQIVGLVARRIVCTARVDDVVQRGERIGMIKFGSRTELIVPKWLAPQVAVSVGQKVQGAADVLVKLGHPAEGASFQPPVDEEFERIVPRETPA